MVEGDQGQRSCSQRGDRMSQDQLRAKARRLIAAANELLAIAHELEVDEAGDNPVDANTPYNANDTPIWAEVARSAYRERRRRGEVFNDPTLFGEPAWDIMLDLFIAAKERKRLPVTSACIGAAVPVTTALRWLTVLEDKGLILRENDTADARRVFVRLSTDGYEKMIAYFSSTAGKKRMSDDIEPRTLRIAN